MPEPAYDDRGLVPCIVQDATTGAVLMLAVFLDVYYKKKG